jgi:RNA polymerase sigma-70 factor (ECF subfamily)
MSFDAIYKDYYGRIFRLCMGYVNDPEWARDITQEIFITVWQQLAQFKGASSVGTWIFRIAANQCLRQLERQERMPRGAMPEQLAAPPTPQVEAQIQFLYQCIAALPELDRIIISLELENVKQAEIAGIVGLSEANVRVRIHRIKEKLALKFSSYEG